MIVCSRTLYQAMQFFELRDAVFKHHLRLPSEKFSRFGDIGTSVLGLNTRLNEHCRAPDHFRDLAYRIIFSAADVDGFSCANIPGARGNDIRATACHLVPRSWVHPFASVPKIATRREHMPLRWTPAAHRH